MNIEGLVTLVGKAVTANLEGADSALERVKSVAGELVSVSRNWANEYEFRFRDGERVTLLEGDTVTIGGERFTLA